MHLSLLLQSLSYLGDLVCNLFHSFCICEKGIDGFLIVAHLILSLLKLVTAWVVVGLLSQVFNL